ncbi:MAG: multidrug efflux MFS transporter [Defluviitaleaceae bacterium]|nr:multidrug efflux MFS transporter [Defluviitaleaceae bacterium]
MEKEKLPKEKLPKVKQPKEKLPKGMAAVALIMVLGALPPMLDSTIVNVAVNSLKDIFGTSLSTIQWTVTGYVLALGIAVPFSGWLIQRMDGKKIFMSALAAFLAGSFLSGIAWNVASLVIFRVCQGLAAGILITSLSTLIVQMAGSDNLGKMMSLVGIPAVFGPIVGPVIGGLIMQYLPWNWLFFVNLPVGVIAIILIGWKVPKFEAANKSAKLDLPGVVILAITSGTLIYGITEVVKANSRTSGIEFLSVGAAAFIGYVIYALRRKEKSLIPLDMFRSKHFTAAFISLFLSGFALNGPMFLLPMLFQNVFLQNSKGFAIIFSALWLLPQGIGMLIARPMVGKLVDKIGARYVTLPAILITLLGTIPFAFIGANTPPVIIWAILLVRGAGVGGFIVPLMADCFVGLPKAQVPQASVATRIIQNIGGAFGSAVLATIVSNILLRQQGDSIGAYHTGFFTSLIFMVVSIVPALFLTNKLKSKRAAAAQQ